jgi:hypothetical protein
MANQRLVQSAHLLQNGPFALRVGLSGRRRNAKRPLDAKRMDVAEPDRRGLAGPSSPTSMMVLTKTTTKKGV